MRHLAALALLTMLLPAAALAQRGGGIPPFGGPRGAFSFELSDGEPVSFYLEWARVLELTELQKTGLIEVRRKLRIQNEPFMTQLDSLRQEAGVNMETRGRLDERDAAAFRRLEQWAAPVIDSIRINNDGARREIRLILDERQMARGDSLAREMRAMDPRRRSAPVREDR